MSTAQLLWLWKGTSRLRHARAEVVRSGPTVGAPGRRATPRWQGRYASKWAAGVSITLARCPSSRRRWTHRAAAEGHTGASRGRTAAAGAHEPQKVGSGGQIQTGNLLAKSH